MRNPFDGLAAALHMPLSDMRGDVGESGEQGPHCIKMHTANNRRTVRNQHPRHIVALLVHINPSVRPVLGDSRRPKFYFTSVCAECDESHGDDARKLTPRPPQESVCKKAFRCTQWMP